MSISRLAVYGTLAPGESNHHMLDGLPGRWQPGIVRGHRFDWMWRGRRGFPGFVADPTGDEIEILVFASEGLESSWPALDAFEGPGYRRRRIEVELVTGEVVPAHVYQTVLHHEHALATYGTLAPGESNHWVVRPIPGSWLPAMIRGYRYDLTWGPAEGYPGLTLDGDGHRVPVEVLVSTELDRFWAELDRFEGPGYRRRPVELFDRRRDSGDGDQDARCGGKPGGDGEHRSNVGPRDDDGDVLETGRGPLLLGTATVFEALVDS